MWQRQLYISPFVRWLRIINRTIPGGEIHNLKLPSDQNFHAYQSRFAPHLSFFPEEENIGKQYLRKVGLRDEDKFLCFFSRDSRYLDEVYAYRSREEWSYHDFRDASIENHVPAIEYMVQHNGYYAFRMGSLVKERLNTNNPKIIDYASNGDRTELLDLYLCANCYFFLQSGGSGIASVARVFQRPLVPVNQVPLQWCHGNPVTVFIPKKLWLKGKKRFMTFKEILESGVGMYMKSQEYECAGIECVQNTPEEITATVIEADKRIRGIWKSTQEDDVLQKQFQSLFSESELCGRQRSLIGASFLRQNRDLLE
ncbi:MAG: TIGR04372 family glycosyltransferase [Desulfobacterales bacterium]